MGVEYSHKCNKCSYSIVTSGPWEFYRDNKGRFKYYGHPIPVSMEAKKAGIYGYSAIVYCPNCDQTSKVIVEEYKKPYKNRGGFSLFSLSPFLWRMLNPRELKDEYKKEGAVKCPECGNTKLIRSDQNDNVRIVTCRRCKEGKLIPKRDWIS